MKEIELTKGYKTQVDDEDYEYLSQFTWHVLDNHGTFYARTAKKINNRVYCTYMHRMIIDCPPELEIDHIDHNPLNNQRSNLRCVSHSENLYNRKSRRNDNCPKCGKPKALMQSYCKSCYNDYQREYKKRSEVKKKATEYKREYRLRKKSAKTEK